MSDRPYMPTQSEPSAEALALAKAKLARLVAECFVEPNTATRERLVHISVRTEALDAVEVLNISAAMVASVCDAILSTDDWAEAHNRLFGHTVRAACPPYEIEYLQAEVFQQSQTLADIAGFYAAFGFEVRGTLAERVDHVVSQWEFLAALAMKESIAIAADDDDAISCCRDAQRAFLAEHVARWMPAFFERVRRAEQDAEEGGLYQSVVKVAAGVPAGRGWRKTAHKRDAIPSKQTSTTACYPAIVDLADALLRRWCDEMNVELGPDWIELRPDCEEDAVITCGAGGGEVELGPTMSAAIEKGGSEALSRPTNLE